MKGASHSPRPYRDRPPAGGKRIADPGPSWLPAEAKGEWRRAVADLARRGLLFDGALASLKPIASIAQVRQTQRLLTRAS